MLPPGCAARPPAQQDHEPGRRRRPGRQAQAVDPTPPGRARPAPPQGDRPHGRPDLPAPRTASLPARRRSSPLTLDSYGRVRDDGSPVDPHTLRLPAGRLGRGALPGPAGPVLAEPAPRRGLERPVLRLDRTATPPRPARPLRHPRHHAPQDAAAGRRRHLPPGVVAPHRHRRLPPTTPPSRSGTERTDGTSTYRRPDHRPAAAHLGRGHGRSTTSWTPTPTGNRSTWCASASRSKPIGVIAGTPQADKMIGYLSKYITKSVADCHPANTAAAEADTATAVAGAARTPRARRAARTGCATASNPTRPAPSSGPGTARPRSTSPTRWASAAAASSSPGTGPARPSPTTATTNSPGSAKSCARACSPQRKPATTRTRPTATARARARPARRRRPATRGTGPDRVGTRPTRRPGRTQPRPAAPAHDLHPHPTTRSARGGPGGRAHRRCFGNRFDADGGGGLMERRECSTGRGGRVAGRVPGHGVRADALGPAAFGQGRAGSADPAVRDR